MEEPKRRVRRAPMERNEQPTLQQEPTHIERQEEPAQNSSVHRRRRAQAVQPVQMQNEEPPKDAHRSKGHAAKPAGPAVKSRKQSKEKTVRTLKQALLGAAVLLGMAGTAAARAAKKIKREHLRIAAMALCACVAAVSAWQVGSIVLRSVRTNKLNDELARQRAAIIEAQEEAAQPLTIFEPTAQPVMTAAPEATVQPAPMTAQNSVPAAAAMQDVVKTTKYHQVGGDALPEMAQMHQKNRDLVAWIQIPDVLDLPVVYRDNDYYLTRDFSKQKNASGTIFLDENHPFKEKTQNLLLHGHNMKDGTMFGRLAQYLYDGTYLRNHPFIHFDTLWSKEQYVIFAVLDVSLKPSDSRFFNYFTHDTFSSDTEFAMYIRQLQLRSEYAIPIDVAPSDALLTLSTCLDDDRLVIVARRLREGETRSDLRTLIRMATKQ